MLLEETHEKSHIQGGPKPTYQDEMSISQVVQNERNFCDMFMTLLNFIYYVCVLKRIIKDDTLHHL